MLSDVATLQLDDEDLKEIPKCKPGDCGVKLSDRAMQYLQKEIDWTSPQAKIQAHSSEGTVMILVDVRSRKQRVSESA